MFVSKKRYKALCEDRIRMEYDLNDLRVKLEAEQKKARELHWENYALKARLLEVERMVNRWRDKGK